MARDNEKTILPGSQTTEGVLTNANQNHKKFWKLLTN